MMNEQFQQAADWIRQSQQLVVFTGAGISAESGIPTFRDDHGFWLNFPPSHFATWQGLTKTALRRPKQFAEFIHAVIAPLAEASPNAAHLAIAEAEKHLPVTIVTQNIDNLHQEAGSTVVHAVHGSFFEIVNRSGRFHSLVSRREMRHIVLAIQKSSRGILKLPRIIFAMRRLIGLNRRGLYHPNLIMFGDKMAEPAWSKGLSAAQQCDCLLQIGCSGMVLPAALLPMEAKARGACIITVDLDNNEGDIALKGRAAEIIPMLFREAFKDSPPPSS
jgi:NAD-dependent deacetylase